MSMTSPGDVSGTANGAAGALIKDTTTQAFSRDVLEESRSQPVLVDFWAPWCGPCKTLGPIIEKSVTEARGAVKLVKMNLDDHPEVAGQLGIQSIPAVIAFQNGQPVDGFVGALPEGQVKAFIERIAGPAGPTDADMLLEQAAEMLAAKDIAGAAERFAAVLSTDAESVSAIVGLAECHLAAGNLDAARQTLGALPEKAQAEASVTALRAKIDLAEQTAHLGDPAALEARIAADPKDHQARFDLALILNAQGDREGATDRLLEIFAANRSWEEEKARIQLLQFFEAWGPADEATLSGRRRLSSLLFS